MGSTTSFDPNTKNIESYLDPNVSVAFEPGSTMKIFSYMAVMEAGKYNGSETFMSGTYTTKDGTVIGDWDRNGWGMISYDKGFALSSNVGVSNLINKYIDRDTLMEYYKKLGFGSKTGIELSKETAGKLNFKYETEVLNAGFGQGIMVTSIQNIKALTSIANDGILLQPYIVDKIVDSDGNVVEQHTRTELGRVASKDTTDKIKDLMESVVLEGTGTTYYMEGYNLIAKTGTAQIASTNGTGYLTGSYDVIRGFAGMFPKDDPEIIIYANVTRPHQYANALSYVIKSVVENVSKYYNIYDESDEDSENITYTVDSYMNKSVDSVKDELENNGITVEVIGNGNTIINQYPSKGTVVTTGTKVFIVTNSTNITIPNFKGWSKKDVITYLNLANIPYETNGIGYLVSQSIINQEYQEGMVLELEFEEKYN
jgi:penicillin-binding protein 2B